MPKFHESTFEYLKPTNEQIEQMSVFRTMTKGYAGFIEDNLPDGPDKTYILRKVREIGFWGGVTLTREADGSPRE